MPTKFTKERLAELASIHSHIKWRNGPAKFCMNRLCEGKSKFFDWAKIKGLKYTRNPNDYFWLCRKCHKRYDATPKKRVQAIKNLWWVKGIPVPNKKQSFCNICGDKHKARGFCINCYNHVKRSKDPRVRALIIKESKNE